MEKIFTLDKLDKKILVALTENARYSYSTIAKMVGTKREVVTYRIKKLIDSGVIKKFSISLFKPSLGLNHSYDLELKFGPISNEKLKLIITELSKEELITIISETDSTHKLSLRIVCKEKIAALYTIKKIKNICGDLLQDYEIQDIIADNYASRLPFLNEEKIELKKAKKGAFQNIFEKTYKPGVKREKNYNFKDFELKILDILYENSRTPLITIAKKTNLEIMKVKYTIEKLIKKGIIYTFDVHIDDKKIGFHNFMFLVKTTGNEKEEKIIVKKFKEQKSCMYLAQYIGQWDFLFTFKTKNTEEIKKIANEIFKGPENIIVEYKIIEIIKNYKFTGLPIPLAKIYNSDYSTLSKKYQKLMKGRPKIT